MPKIGKLETRKTETKTKKYKWLHELTFISKRTEKNPVLSVKLRGSGLTLLIKKTLKN